MRLLPLLHLFLLLVPRLPSPRERVFDQPAKMACERIVSAKFVLLLFLVSLLSMSLLACADDGSSGSSSSGSGSGSSKSSVVLDLLPDDTSSLEVLDVSAILGGGVPESFEERFETQWERYSLGDDIVTIDDVSEMVQAYSKDGGILMLSGSQIDFAGIGDWLTSDEGNIERISYQGQDLWGGDSRALVILDGYLIQGDTEALKEILKVKARGTGSLNQASDNALKKAYEDARAGWYVMASENCDEFSSSLRACEAYSITGGPGTEDYLVAASYRFQFRSEQRAESQALDIEDLIDDQNWDVDLNEVKAEGTSVEAQLSGDEEDFHLDWLVNYRDMGVPPPLPKAAPKADSNATTGTTTVSASGQPRAAPAATNQEKVVPWPPGEPTMAPPRFYDSDTGMGSVDGPEASWERLDSCLVELRSTGSLVGKWDGSCYSPRTGIQAHYFTFSLPRDAFVEITVSPDDADYRTSMEGHFESVSGQVVVLSGEGMDGEVLVEDNYQYRDVLPAGTYTIEATHKNDGELFPVEYFELRFFVE
jgi:hypothetical protein